MTINYTNNNFGTVEKDGVTVNLTDDAFPTCRLLPAELNATEWAAHGVDNKGNKMMVYWVFDNDKTDGLEAEDYDWDNVSRIENAE